LGPIFLCVSRAVCTSLEAEPTMGDPSRPRHLQAPRESGGKLVAPPLSEAGRLIDAHRAALDASDYDVQGRTLVQLAAEARRQLIDEAVRYTRSYRDVETAASAADENSLQRLVLAGHQPELFHPGVWFKNFAMSRVAAATGAVAVNLIVDSDTIKASSLRVPTGSLSQPAVEAVLFDQPATAIPFEERRIRDRALFESLGTRATAKLATLLRGPMLDRFWPDVVKRSRDTDRLGECLAQARHIWEGRWGATTLEIPQSRVCSLRAFHRFAAHLLAHLPRLWDIYNAALAEYRRANHIRSHAHPVPALAGDDDWLEAPLWIWRADDPVRRRLFVRSRDDQVVLADRTGWEQPIELSADSEPDRAIDQLQALADGGVRLRTRALITTMLARVLLGDLFIHGIGGAKYDQMTDALVERFFGLEPPPYMVVSGTLQLPIEHPRDTAKQLCNARQQLRQLIYQPERFIEDHSTGAREERSAQRSAERSGGEPWRSIQTKRSWIATPQTFENRRARFQAIRSANEALQPWVNDRRTELMSQIEELQRAARAEAILSSREYSFCLYPESMLREFLTRGE
jgi:hypothetical protein